MNPTPAGPEPEVPGDEAVIRRILAGETRLFEQLMRRNNERIFRAARAILRDDAEAEDVMQETYVRAYAKLGSFEGRSLFSTWLTKIAVYEALARVRHRRHFDLLDPSEELEGELAMTTPSSDHDPEQHLIDQEMSAVVERAIDALPNGFRAVFMLRAVQELSTAEAADCLGIPEDTVKTRFHRARGLLQKALFLRAETALPRAFPFHLRRCDRIVAAVMLRIATERGSSDA